MDLLGKSHWVNVQRFVYMDLLVNPCHQIINFFYTILQGTQLVCTDLNEDWKNLRRLVKRYNVGLEAFPKKKWSLTHDKCGCRYDHMTTNLSDAVNQIFKGA